VDSLVRGMSFYFLRIIFSPLKLDILNIRFLIRTTCVYKFDYFRLVNILQICAVYSHQGRISVIDAAYDILTYLCRGGSRISSYGGALKKIAPSGGSREKLWGIS
jgi:hypothetical protein